MCAPRFLVLFLFLSAGLALAAEPEGKPVPPSVADDEASPSWHSLHDFDEMKAFEMVGPPTHADALRVEEETALYLDMITYYEEFAEDDDDFAFVAEAFSVSLDELRPASLRIMEEGVDDVFADDPLPGQVKSTSFYVDRIRVPTLPGYALKPRALDDVKLGEAAKHSLFEDKEKPKPKPEEKEEEKKAEAPKPKEPEKPVPPPLPPSIAAGQPKPPVPATAATAPPASVPAAAAQAAGQINKPVPQAKPYNPDEETLQLLQQAVRDLGLEKQLNFESSPFGQQTLLQSKDGKTPAPPPVKQDVPTPAEPAAKTFSPAPENKKTEDAKAGGPMPTAEPKSTEAGAQPAAEKPAAEKAEEKKVEEKKPEEVAPTVALPQTAAPAGPAEKPKKKRRKRVAPPPEPVGEEGTANPDASPVSNTGGF